MQGARKRLEREEIDRRSLAFNVAALSRAEKLPNPKTFLAEKPASAEPQSPDVLEAMGRALAKAWGADPIS